MTRGTSWLLRALPFELRTRVGDQLLLSWHDGYLDHRRRGRRAALAFIWREGRAYAGLVIGARWQSAARVATLLPSRNDVRSAWRRFTATPLASLVSTTLLAVAMAGAVVTLAVADAVLWRPLPLRQHDRLAVVWEDAGAGSSEPSRVTGWRYEHWKSNAHATAFESLAAFGAAGFQVDAGDGLTFVRGVRVTGNFFRVLGVEPALGRLIQPADQEGDAAAVVVLSHHYWMTHFGGRPSVVGESLRLSDTTYQVIGVLPDIWLPSWPVNPATIRLDRDLRSVWVPMAPSSALARNTRSHLFGVIGRLPEGQTTSAAQDALAALTVTADPDTHSAIVRPLREQMVATSRTAMVLLALAALGLVLVAACNLSAEELASHHRRADEFLVRRALGAGRGALTRLLIAEQSIRLVAACVMAAAVTHSALSGLAARLDTSIPLLTRPVFDVRTGAWLVTLAALVAVVLVTWPLLRMRRMERSLTQVTSRVAGGHGGFGVLLGAQVVGAVALVILGLQLSDALMTITRRDPGFDPAGVRAIELSLPRDRYRDPQTIAAFEDALLARLGGASGVTAVTLSHDHPFTANWLDIATVQGTLPEDDARQQVQLRIVDPGYTDAMQARVIDGRTFDAGIRADWSGQVLVNEAFVRARGAGVGHQLLLSSPRGTWGDRVPAQFVIVGVLADERLLGLDADFEPAVYVTTRQFPQTDLTLLARFGGNDSRESELPALIRAVEPRVSVGPIRELVDLEAEQRLERTLLTSIVGANALAALILAIVGLSSLLSLVIAARERELGIRMALGARPAALMKNILMAVARPVACGVAGGMLAAALGTWALRAWLVGATAVSMSTAVSVAAVLAAAALTAAVVPILRFRRTDPIQSIRR